MTNKGQHRRYRLMPRMGPRTATAALALALVLVPGMMATATAQAQTFKVLYAFTGGADGGSPATGLIQDPKGNLYGTTAAGGYFNCGIFRPSHCGVVFELDETGKETVLYSFCSQRHCPDGRNPAAGLIRDALGNLYGTTTGGGTGHDAGTVFKLDKASKETVLRSFNGGSDGAYPYASLLRDAYGNLYGTTFGDALSYGTVFMLDQTGKYAVLYGFSGGVDGGSPLAGLIQDPEGNLYGTTAAGGSSSNCGSLGCGTVFKLDVAGNETVLHSFSDNPDGYDPIAGLTRDAEGNLYGTTWGGGRYGVGTVFMLDETGKETVLYSFTRADGANPGQGYLVRDEKGTLYGTTQGGGASGYGTVFMLDDTGKETVLHSFTGGADGATPDAGLLRDAKGNLYGTTTAGGASGAGTVFELTPAVASSTWYVNGVNGSNSNNCTSAATACKTIGHAISLASSGDTIRVAAGNYKENLAIGKSLNLLGSGASTTIIDGGGAGTVVTISNATAHVVLSKFTIRDGVTGGGGGGVLNQGILIIGMSTISFNSAHSGCHECGGSGGGVANSGNLTLNNSAVTGNTVSGIFGAGFGGGIFNFNNGTVTVNNSTLTGNLATGRGGGIDNEGNLTINNSTLSGNSVQIEGGGGIENEGKLLINSSTISGNSAHFGGGIDNFPGSTVSLQNSIVANSPSGGNCSGTITSRGYNLSSDGTCNFNGPGDMNNTDPLLGPLQNNGGPTQTMALLPASPAIDAGNPSGCTDGHGHLLKTDQRGQPRPDKEDTGGCDMGSYERQSD